MSRAQVFGDFDDATGKLVGLVNRDPGATSGAVPGDGKFTTGAPLFFGFGDSITADGGYTFDANGVRSVSVLQYSWHRYAELASNGAAVWGGSFGQATYTIEQLREQHLPTLLRYAPRGSAVLVLMGQNNGTVTAETRAAYTDCVQQMSAAGLVPVLCTLTPKSASYSHHSLQAHIVKLANGLGLQLCDLQGAVIDPATGLWLAANTRDGTHPTQAGAALMGARAGATLQRVFPRQWVQGVLAQHDVNYGPSRSTQTGGTSNPIFRSSAGSGADVPTGWTVINGGFTGLCTYAAAAYGRSMTLNAPASGEGIIRNLEAVNVQPGDVCRVSGIMTTVLATNGYVRWGIFDGAAVPLYDLGRNSAQGGGVAIARSPFCAEFVHSGAAGLRIDFVVGWAGSSVTLEQFSVVNLTALGVA